MQCVSLLSFFCRWTDLPNMPTGRLGASALCVQTELEAILVVGGDYFGSREAPRCAELLTHTAGTSGRGGATWRWRQLNPMHDAHEWQPGMLLLSSGGDRQRVLVAGGGRSATAEILHLSCRDPSDSGQWTRIARLSMRFSSTFLVEFNSRVFAIGSFLACISPSLSNDLILNLFGLLDLYSNVNELSSNAPGQLTVREILRSWMPFSVCAFF